MEDWLPLEEKEVEGEDGDWRGAVGGLKSGVGDCEEEEDLSSEEEPPNQPILKACDGVGGRDEVGSAEGW